MKNLRHLSEITTRYGTRNINELEFDSPEEFAAYKKKHKAKTAAAEASTDANENLFTEVLPNPPRKTKADTSTPTHQASVFYKMRKSQQFSIV